MSRETLSERLEGASGLPSAAITAGGLSTADVVTPPADAAPGEVPVCDISAPAAPIDNATITTSLAASPAEPVNDASIPAAITDAALIEAPASVPAAPRASNSHERVDGLKVHPLARALPSMLPAERADLFADIKAKGLRQPIVLYEQMILDGRHRAEACAELGIVPSMTTFTGTADEAKSLVLSLNVHRRHLTYEQECKIIDAELDRDPAQSDRAIAKKAHVDHKTVAKARSAAKANGEIPHYVERREASGRKARGRKGSSQPPQNMRKTGAKLKAPKTNATKSVSTKDIIGDLKLAVTTRLSVLTVEERAHIVRHLIAHLQISYLPEHEAGRVNADGVLGHELDRHREGQGGEGRDRGHHDSRTALVLDVRDNGVAARLASSAHEEAP